MKHEYFKDIKEIIPPAVYKRFEQDILLVKPINFKGFLPAKSSKPPSSEIPPRKFAAINFHNVTSRVKQNTNVNKVYERPLFLR